MASALVQLYNRLILKQPIYTLIITALLSLFLAWQIQYFRLDASADSLVLENDQALKYYRSIKARYGSDEFLVITYSPQQDLFSAAVLEDIRQLRDNLRALDRVDSVNTILDVPLTQSPPVSLSELSEGIRTLETEGIDTGLARKEFLTSPLYLNMLMSPDAKTTALQVNLKRDETHHKLLTQRNLLREKQLQQPLSKTESAELERISSEFKEHSHSLQDQDKQLIINVRALMDQHRDKAKLFLGGVPMIASDSVDFIQSDLMTFGVGAILFIIVTLFIAFRKARWVLLPMLTCFLSGLMMLGLLGLMEWRVTVVSSNFISLLLIITLSLTIHLIVRYRECHANDPGADQHALIFETVRSKFLPSFYTAITTMVAFGSLLISGIRPVIDFGWIMIIGIGIAFVLTFTFFPAALVLLKPGEPSKLKDITGNITHHIASFIHRFNKTTILGFVLFAVISSIGIFNLTVENRFIDYYKDSTEIYRGMELIDKELGGTMPLDIIIDAPSSFFAVAEPTETDSTPDELDLELELELEGEAGITASYWFNYNMMEQIKQIHHYIESLPETGKVLSIYTTINMMEQLRDNDDMDDFFLAIIHKRVPDIIKTSLFNPYLAIDGNQIRYSVRIFESDKSLQRNAMLEKINDHLVNEVGLEKEQVHLSGMVVLYNNMLQSLFKSQILTIGVVFLAILAMFAVLFRSFYIAVLAIIPNMVAASMVLGIMGLLGIPLDIMTITIAAICIGIAVDDTIHYVHRFEIEFARDHDYWASINRCHASIGRAMYYTSLIITLGFSILALSSFIPMIYFGLLTGFAMMMALLANLTLLPVLLAMFKPVRT
ncbi:MAG: MMPL family transporter [Gammaproteobacteria bacterium]|nr:MMPL family transporter [Gammaproteobacteria bacterium]